MDLCFVLSILFIGCQFHGCIRKKCTVLQNPTRDSINCFGRQHGELQDEWNKKMERFMLQYGPNGQDLVHEFMVIFECEWKERKQTDQLVIDFMLNR